MKRIVSIILSISLAILSLPTSFAATETDNIREKLSVRKLLEGSQYAEKILAHDFEVSSIDRYENIKQKGNSQLIEFGSDHGKVWSPGHTFFHTKEKVDSGLVIISFDIIQQTSDAPTFYLRTGDETHKKEGGAAGKMSETLAGANGSLGYYANAAGWTVQSKATARLGEWYEMVALIDLDNDIVGYIIDETFYNGGSYLRQDEISTLYISCAKPGSALIDNLNAYKVDRRIFEDAEMKKKLGITERFTDSVNVTFKVGELGNALYKRTPSIKGNVVIYNRGYEEREIDVEALVATRGGKKLGEHKFSTKLPPRGTSETPITVSANEEYGYYDVHIKLYDKGGSEPFFTGVRSYSLVRAPENFEQNPKYGINIHYRTDFLKNEATLGNPKDHIELARKAGFTTARSMLKESNWVASNGMPENNLYEEIRDIGMGVCDIIYGNEYAPGTKEAIDSFVNDFAVESVGEIIKIFGSTGNVEFEMWNEWNNHGSWFNRNSEPPSAYAEFAKTLYTTLKPLYPDATFWGMAPVGVANSWVYQVLDAMENVAYMDGISIHPYERSTTPDAGPAILQSLQIKEELAKRGMDPLPLRATEWGWATTDIKHQYEDREKLQAAYYIRFVALCEQVDLYQMSDYYEMVDGMNETTEDRFGMVRSPLDDVPYGLKPMYFAVSNYNRLMNGATPVEQVNLDNDDTSLHFKLRDGRDCAIVYNTKNNQSYNAVNLGCDKVTVCDMYGNEKELYAIDGAFNLSLDSAPIYLIGDFDKVVDAEPMFITNEVELQAKKNDISVLKIARFSDRDFGIEIEQNDLCAITDEAFKGVTKNVKVKFGEEVYNTEINYYMTYGGKPVMYDKIVIEPASAIEANVSVKPKSSTALNKWVATFELVNKSEINPLSGTLYIEEPFELRVEEKINNLATGAKKTLSFDIPESIKKEHSVTIKGRFIDDEGNEIPFNVSQEMELCIKSKSEKKIDGVLTKDEWNNQSGITFRDGGTWIGITAVNQNYSGVAIDGGNTDLSGRLYAEWDDKYFYLAADIVDDIWAYDEKEPDRLYRADSIQFAMAPFKGSGDLAQFCIARMGDGDKLQIDRSPVASMIGIPDKSLYDLAISREGEHTYYELRLPWEVIFPDGYLAEKNGQLAITLLINDNDGYGRKAYLEYGTGMGTGNANSSGYRSFYMWGERLIDEL